MRTVVLSGSALLCDGVFSEYGSTVTLEDALAESLVAMGTARWAPDIQGAAESGQPPTIAPAPEVLAGGEGSPQPPAKPTSKTKDTVKPKAPGKAPRTGKKAG